MLWAIYVSDKPHSRINFPIGMQEGIWGVHDSKQDTVSSIKSGDIVTFVYSISWLKSEGPPPKGFSRVSKEKLDDFRGFVQQLITVRVTNSYYHSDKDVWPDDTYPHRFDFEIIERHQDGVFFGTEFFNKEFVEAVRYSACTQGSVTLVSHIETIQEIKTSEDSLSDDSMGSGIEGKPIWRLHKTRERNKGLVSKKKKSVLDTTGKLECEVCRIDFAEVYGDIGFGFAECHHKNPLSLRDGNEETTLDDLAILCANCHRMIHRQKPWMTLLELRRAYNDQKN